MDEKSARIQSENGLICARCGVPLEKSETKFDYLGHKFTHQVPKCPVCGMVYVPEDLVGGRMQEVETMLEDK